MTVNRIIGFETGTLDAEMVGATAGTTFTGAVSIENTIVRSGAHSLKIQPASGANAFWSSERGAITVGGTAPVRLRFALQVTVLPATTRAIIPTASARGLKLTPTGALELWDGLNNRGASSTLLTDTNKWYIVEISATTTQQILRIDGTDEVTFNGAALTASISARIGCDDTVAATYTAYVDDIIYTNGEAGFQGDGKVLLLRPESDDTVTAWTAGNGGTTSLFAAVDNDPPAGVASASETNTTNIESASNTGTANYIANLETYTAKGITGVVNAVQPIARHGEDVATGTKTGTIETTANPVIGTTAFTVGLDAGAHAAEVNLWMTLRGTGAMLPAPALGTAPKMKVVKTDTGTRVVCVDMMGLYVDYTPAAPAAFPFPRKDAAQAVRDFDPWSVTGWM